MPTVFTIPPHVAFVDALAKGLLARTAGDPMRLARGIVLLPNRRAVRALSDAFVRQSEGRALLLRWAASLAISRPRGRCCQRWSPPSGGFC